MSDINSDLERCGYKPITPPQARALDSVLGQFVWRNWLADSAVKGESSTHWEPLRSALFGASHSVAQLLESLDIAVPVDQRIKIVTAHGRPLRAAVATLMKATDAPAALAAAESFIRKSFKSSESNFADRVHHVYATKAAIAIESAFTKEGRACLQIEAAQRSTFKPGFDWTSKIVLQLTEAEAISLLCVLRGWSTSFELANHGEHRDKRLTFSKPPNQSGYLASVRQGSIARVVPVPATESFRITSLLLATLLKNSPHLSVQMIDDMAKQVAQAS